MLYTGARERKTEGEREGDMVRRRKRDMGGRVGNWKKKEAAMRNREKGELKKMPRRLRRLKSRQGM